MRKNNRTAAADGSVDDAAHAGLLEDLLGRIAPCSARRETRLTCRDMVNGILAELDDRNCWTMAEAAGHPGPHKMQHLLSRARVDDQRMLEAAADWAAGYLCAGQDPGDVVLIVDEAGDAKTSGDCAGAARQYSATLGGIAMCQVAVTLTCASPAGHALIGRVLYLPADWAADEERRELARVPDDVMFSTKPRLADGLLQDEDAHNRGIRAAFIAGDEVYGGLDLRTSIRQRGTGYVMAVRSNHMVTLPSGRRLTVKNAGLVKSGMWQRMRTGQATRGAKDYHWAMIEVTPGDTPAGHDDGHAALRAPPRPGPPLRMVAMATPTPVPGPASPPALARLRRRTATITIYNCRIEEKFLVCVGRLCFHLGYHLVPPELGVHGAVRPGAGPATATPVRRREAGAVEGGKCLAWLGELVAAAKRQRPVVS